MAHTCNAEGCYRPRWGGGFCTYHQRLREDKKPKNIAPHTAKERISTIDFGFEDQLSMFHALWENAGDEKGYIICPFTGMRLNGFYGTDLWVNCFLHILPKKNYTYFKLNPANIAIAYPEFHRIVDAGTQKERAEHPTWRFDLWDARVIAMKAEYAVFKQKNLLA